MTRKSESRKNAGLSNKACDVPFIEIAPPGIPHRALINVEHILQVSFGEKWIEDAEGAKQFDGFMISLVLGGQEQEFVYKDIRVAMSWYNDLIKEIADLTPCNHQPPLEPLPAPEPSVDTSVPAEED